MKALVLDSVSSPITKRVYNMALDEFMAWFRQEPWPGFTKATVSACRASIDARGLGSSSIIIRMPAIRKLAAEAADNGLIAPELAAGIARVKRVKSTGIRVDWLSLLQAQALLSAPEVVTVRGFRDQAILRLRFASRSVKMPGMTFYRIGLRRLSEYEVDFEFAFVLSRIRLPFEPSEDDRETMLYHLFGLAWHFQWRFIEHYKREMENFSELQDRYQREGRLDEFAQELNAVVRSLSVDLRALEADAQVRGFDRTVPIRRAFPTTERQKLDQLPKVDFPPLSGGSTRPSTAPRRNHETSTRFWSRWPGQLVVLRKILARVE
jgi:hypothetical protein